MQLFDALLKLIFRDHRLLEWSLSDAVRQCQLGSQGNIPFCDAFSAFKGSLSTRSFKDHKIRPVTFHV